MNTKSPEKKEKKNRFLEKRMESEKRREREENEKQRSREVTSKHMP